MSQSTVFFRLPSYRTIWRWHFYAGLYCVPFVLLLSLSGAVYLFKPQFESWTQRPYDTLPVHGSPHKPSEIVKAAEAENPGSAFRFYEVPSGPGSAARIMLIQNSGRLRTYVDPQTLQIVHSVREDEELMQLVKKLHSELLLGDRGSLFVELAACWTVILLLTGLCLWWPRNSQSLAGVLYPRLRSGSKILWRDLHSVTGIWISGLALILVLTGLPWAGVWGDYFKSVRSLTGTAAARPTWTTRSAFGDQPPAEGFVVEELDLVVDAVLPLNLPHPVQISPPAGKTTVWTVASQTPNRPQRVTLAVDGKTGEILSKHGFADLHVIDKAVNTGIALHEGQLFGWPNQLLGVFATLGLALLSGSGVVMWWRRREPGVLGAPEPSALKGLSLFTVSLVTILGIAMPVFGLSLLFVLALEKLLFARWLSARHWLGLT